jgi:hypothetical protein
MKKFLVLILGLIIFANLNAQEEVQKDSLQILQEQIDANASGIKKLNKLKVSGYVQFQGEYAQEFASTKVGLNTKYMKDRDFESGDYMRFGIRRGRIKFEWTEKMGSATFQIDMTEKGISLKDAYLKIWHPAFPSISLTGGVFNRPFGDEITFSSSKRESPERSLVVQKLFPDERDLGGMLTIAPPKTHFLNGLKLDAGLFSGNGIRQDDDGNLDFIGRLGYTRSNANISWGLGASYYYGMVNNADTFIYNVETVNDVNKWVKTAVEANQLNVRQYWGFDAQFSVSTVLGMTSLRGEIMGGTQPSIKSDFSSPKATGYSDGTTSYKSFNYMRNFIGGHFYVVQDIYRTPFTLVFKYGYLDPNTKLAGDEITDKTDLVNNNYGFGILWRASANVRVQAFYELVKNENTTGIAVNGNADYSKDVLDNVFTLRLQYKF